MSDKQARLPAGVKLTMAQEAWIAEAGNPLTRLARRWRCEDKNRGGASEDTTRETGQRRSRELMEAIDEHGRFGAKIDENLEPGWDG